jgi:DNA-binding CsgD family transcriptional regulator
VPANKCDEIAYAGTTDSQEDNGEEVRVLTLRGVFKDGQIVFLDQVPFTGQRQVLVTFLDTEDEIAVIPNEERKLLLDHIHQSGLGLSPRELQVLESAQQGMQSREIADALGISDGTVRNYLSSIYDKLRVRNRAEAIKKAVELGLLSPLRGL